MIKMLVFFVCSVLVVFVSVVLVVFWIVKVRIGKVLFMIDIGLCMIFVEE